MKLNSSKGRPRILYIPGPGDVFGTYGWWKKGLTDPNNPSIPYSHQVYDLAQEFGAVLHVVTQQPLDEGSAHFDDGSVKFTYLQPRNWKGAAYHIGQILDAKKISSHAKDINYDVIFCQRYFSQYWPFRSNSKSGAKIVLSLHNTLWPISRKRAATEVLLSALNKKSFIEFDRVVCVSESIQRQIDDAFGVGKVKVSKQFPQYLREYRGLFKKKSNAGLNSIVFAGRVERGKGVYSLLKAFSNLLKHHPHVKMTYIGGGRSLEDLKNEVRSLGLDRNVNVLGPQPGEKVFEIIRASDLLVCPTGGGFSEGLAKTPIEAAICGVPSLMTSAVPAADVLGDAARVVPVDDSDALFAAMKELADNPDLLSKMAAATKNCVEPFFDREKSLQAELRRALLEFGYSTV